MCDSPELLYIVHTAFKTSATSAQKVTDVLSSLRLILLGFISLLLLLGVASVNAVAPGESGHYNP